MIREPAGTGLNGVAPSNIFRSRDEKWVVIVANQDNVFRRLCEAMAMPELADGPRFATHLVRGENQEAIEGIVSDWAAGHEALEIDHILNEAGTVCGPIYTIADIFADPQFQAHEMLVDPGEVRWSGHLGGGQPQRGDRLRAAGPLAVGARGLALRRIV